MNKPFIDPATFTVILDIDVNGHPLNIPSTLVTFLEIVILLSVLILGHSANV